MVVPHATRHRPSEVVLANAESVLRVRLSDSRVLLSEGSPGAQNARCQREWVSNHVFLMYSAISGSFLVTTHLVVNLSIAMGTSSWMAML